VTAAAVEALRVERGYALDLARSLTAQEWSTDSACAGWTVKDVYLHMVATARTIVEPGSLPASPDGAEASAELGVAALRGASDVEVIAAYEDWSNRQIEAFAMIQAEPMASTMLPLGDLGTHPMHILANAIVFDHYCHLRHDILSRLDRQQLPHDEASLSATVEWMLAGLPQMCADALSVVDQPLVLELSGPGGGSWTISPGAPHVVISEGVSEAAAATVRSSVHDFVSWGTARQPWSQCCTIEGDAAYAGRVLDAINVI
jgi:uncharacterized protein (TIGR03083 family)